MRDRLQIQLLTSWSECVSKMRTVLVGTLKMSTSHLSKRWVRYNQRLKKNSILAEKFQSL